ncbi:hypothetical protein [Roseibium sp.]|uniref:hypothetical protein n=1 Tax=Roseibium sp. TaxID=1936156 RepID=UPI003A97F8FB
MKTLFFRLGSMAACLIASLAFPEMPRARTDGQTGWAVERTEPNDDITAPVAALPAAPEGLPDGGIATHAGGDIQMAWYTAPTRRYGHGILGDDIEAGALSVQTSNGSTKILTLPETEVFEDRTPRLVDLDGDGKVEVVTIRSSLSLGAAVTVYGLSEAGELLEKATTRFIGRSNRWLNIAAIADFAGNGRKQIAYVETPHIGGTLYLFDYSDGRLTKLSSAYGFSNHAIGSREMDLALTIDMDGSDRPSLVVPSASRKSLKVVTYGTQGWRTEAEIGLPRPVQSALGTSGTGQEAKLYFRLSDGAPYVLSRK